MRRVVLALAALALVAGGFFDGHIAQAAPPPAAKIAKTAKKVAPIKAFAPRCFSDPSGSFCMSCFYVNGTLRCYWKGIVETGAEAKGFAAVAPDDYNMDPGSGGGTEWRRTGGFSCPVLQVAWEEFYYGTNYKTGNATCRWIWE